MRNSRLFAFASLLVAGTAYSAKAAVNSDAVYVSPAHYTNVNWSDFDGPVARLNFVADRSVDCDHVTVNYRDGTTQDVFSGTLFGGERQTVAFPGGPRRVKTVNFACRADNGYGARISLSADIEPAARDYYSLTRDDPDASRVVGMQPIAEPDFGHWANHSIMVSGSGERELNAIALEPVGADAQCRQLTATFDDGSSDNMLVNGGAPLREGEIYRVHVDGQDRSLSGIGLTCQARNSDAVRIRVFGVG